MAKERYHSGPATQPLKTRVVTGMLPNEAKQIIKWQKLVCTFTLHRIETCIRKLSNAKLYHTIYLILHNNIHLYIFSIPVYQHASLRFEYSYVRSHVCCGLAIYSMLKPAHNGLALFALVFVVSVLLFILCRGI